MRSTTQSGMIARVTDADGRLVNIHRAYLTRDGHKAQVRQPKMLMPGDLTEGSAIRLTPVAETLGVAEANETAFAATALYNVPCWSTISSGRLETWIPPEGVKLVIAFGDVDASFTG